MHGGYLWSRKPVRHIHIDVEVVIRLVDKTWIKRNRPMKPASFSSLFNSAQMGDRDTIFRRDAQTLSHRSAKVDAACLPLGDRCPVVILHPS